MGSELPLALRGLTFLGRTASAVPLSCDSDRGSARYHRVVSGLALRFPSPLDSDRSEIVLDLLRSVAVELPCIHPDRGPRHGVNQFAHAKPFPPLLGSRAARSEVRTEKMIDCSSALYIRTGSRDLSLSL